jgi:hypothetical protein
MLVGCAVWTVADDMRDGPKLVRIIATRIERYLARHPHAADSAEGILRWWLGRLAAQVSAADVESALDLLVRRGVAACRTLPDGRSVFARAAPPARQGEHEAGRAPQRTVSSQGSRMMAERLLWSYGVQIVNGPNLAGSGEVPVDAYDKLHVAIDAGDSQTLEILPGATGKVQLLVINPRPPSADLTYDVGGTDVKLDGAHVLIGAGAVGLLSATVGSLTFKNDTTSPAEIDVLVGRTAVS